MVEQFAISAVVLVGVLAVLLGTPRMLTDDGQWPDVLAGLDGIVNGVLDRPRWVEIGIGVVGVIVLGLGVSVFRGSELLPESAPLAWALLVIGFVAVFVATHVNGRRSGLSSAHATLIASSLVGVILLVTVAAVLIDI